MLPLGYRHLLMPSVPREISFFLATNGSLQSRVRILAVGQDNDDLEQRVVYFRAGDRL